MSALRGFAVGTLALVGLEVLSRKTDVATGALGWSLNVFRAALSPDVPAIHVRGAWGTGVPAAKDTGVKGGKVTTDLGPAHATVIAGLNAEPPSAG